MADCYRLEGQTPVEEPDTEAFIKWFTSTDRRVRVTRIAQVEVSTVFLGFNHNLTGHGPPVLFETMVFQGAHSEWSGWTHRSITWAEAETDHMDTIVAVCKQLGVPLDSAVQVFPVLIDRRTWYERVKDED